MINGLKFKTETQNKVKRLIYFTGHPQLQETESNPENKLITRVYGDYGTFSGLLHDSTYGWMPLECASRTLSNLYNLHTCRGCITNGKLELSASMSGPHHYLGHIDPRDYITVHIPQSIVDCIPQSIMNTEQYGLPIYTSYTTSNNHNLAPQDCLDSPAHKPKKRIPADMIFTLPAEKWKWISGVDMTSSMKKRYNFTTPENNKFINTKTGSLATDSLFPNPGILELGVSEIRLQIINSDPETNGGLEYDFSGFGAQIVQNSQPWQFRQSGIQANPHAQHKLRLITYYYGPRYVSDYLMKPRLSKTEVGGSGLFIERHEFIQAITPINPDCGGFVILGQELKTWTGRIIGLELIGVRVPFGWTLLVEPWAIHGDSNLVGLYSMAMTGNHRAMATADTVFLKNHNNGSNIRVVGIDQSGSNINININNNRSITKNPRGIQKLLMTSDKLSSEELANDEEKLKTEILSGCSWLESWYYNPIIWTPKHSKKILASLSK